MQQHKEVMDIDFIKKTVSYRHAQDFLIITESHSALAFIFFVEVVFLEYLGLQKRRSKLKKFLRLFFDLLHQAEASYISPLDYLRSHAELINLDEKEIFSESAWKIIADVLQGVEVAPIMMHDMEPLAEEGLGDTENQVRGIKFDITFAIKFLLEKFLREHLSNQKQVWIEEEHKNKIPSEYQFVVDHFFLTYGVVFSEREKIPESLYNMTGKFRGNSRVNISSMVGESQTRDNYVSHISSFQKWAFQRDINKIIDPELIEYNKNFSDGVVDKKILLLKMFDDVLNKIEPEKFCRDKNGCMQIHFNYDELRRLYAKYFHYAFDHSSPYSKALTLLLMNLVSMRFLQEIRSHQIEFNWVNFSKEEAHADFLHLQSMAKIFKCADHFSLEMSRVGRCAVDFYSSQERMKVRKRRESGSPIETWQDDSRLFGSIINALKMEATAHFNSAREMNEHNFTARALIRAIVRQRGASSWRPYSGVQLVKYAEKLMGKEIDLAYDPSAGWGHRLTALIACEMKNIIINDANENMRPVYENICAAYNHENKSNVVIYSKPAEEMTTAELNLNGKQINFVLTSPPFFDIEKYQGVNQSHVRYDQFDKWLKKFLYEMILICIKAASFGAIFAFHVNQALLKEIEKFITSDEAAGNLLTHINTLVWDLSLKNNLNSVRSESVIIFQHDPHPVVKRNIVSPTLFGSNIANVALLPAENSKKRKTISEEENDSENKIAKLKIRKEAPPVTVVSKKEKTLLSDDFIRGTISFQYAKDFLSFTKSRAALLFIFLTEMSLLKYLRLKEGEIKNFDEFLRLFFELSGHATLKHAKSIYSASGNEKYNNRPLNHLITNGGLVCPYIKNMQSEILSKKAWDIIVAVMEDREVAIMDMEDLESQLVPQEMKSIKHRTGNRMEFNIGAAIKFLLDHFIKQHLSENECIDTEGFNKNYINVDHQAAINKFLLKQGIIFVDPVIVSSPVYVNNSHILFGLNKRNDAAADASTEKNLTLR